MEVTAANRPKKPQKKTKNLPSGLPATEIRRWSLQQLVRTSWYFHVKGIVPPKMEMSQICFSPLCQRSVSNPRHRSGVSPREFEPTDAAAEEEHDPSVQRSLQSNLSGNGDRNTVPLSKISTVLKSAEECFPPKWTPEHTHKTQPADGDKRLIFSGKVRAFGTR